MTTADVQNIMPEGQVSLVRQAASALSWPDHMEVFRIDSDSMSPTLQQGDYVVIDTKQRSLKQAVYALRFGESVVIRRLQPLLNRKILIKLDNPAYQDNEIDRAYLEGDVIGRVVLAEKHIY